MASETSIIPAERTLNNNISSDNAFWRQLALPISCLLLGMFSIQFGASLAKSLFPAYGSIGTATLRILFAAAMMAIIFKPWKIRLSRDNWKPLFLYGASLGAMNLTFYKSLETVPLGIAVAIEFIGPLSVVIFSSRRRTDFIWIILALAGLLMLAPWSGTSDIDMEGASYALLAGIFWGIYIVAGQKTGKEHGSRAAGFGMVVAAMVAAPIGFSHAGTDLLNPALLPMAVAVALLSSAIPYSLEMIALPRLSATTFGTLMSLEPAIASLAGLLWLQEKLSPQQGIAIIAIMAASAGATLTAMRIKAP